MNMRRHKFEEYRNVRDPWMIEELLEKTRNQVDLAVHYQIPYPRPQYVDRARSAATMTFVASLSATRPSSTAQTDAAFPGNTNRKVSAIIILDVNEYDGDPLNSPLTLCLLLLSKRR
jgi:hypothetical protein